MTNQNILIPIDASSDPAVLISSIRDPKSTYTLFLSTKRTKPQEYETVESLRKQLRLPAENHITINISSIIQKTWRIIKHYSPNQPVPKKNTPHRQTTRQKVTQTNKHRLSKIEQTVKEMVLIDQATKLNAKIIQSS